MQVWCFSVLYCHPRGAFCTEGVAGEAAAAAAGKTKRAQIILVYGFQKLRSAFSGCKFDASLSFTAMVFSQNVSQEQKQREEKRATIIPFYDFNIYIHASLQEQDPNPYIYVYITPRTLLYVFTSEDKVLVYIYITPRTKSRTTDKKKALFRTRPVRQTSYCFDVSIYILYRYICRYVRSIFFLAFTTIQYSYISIHIHITLHYNTNSTIIHVYIHIYLRGQSPAAAYMLYIDIHMHIYTPRTKSWYIDR